MDGLVFLFVGMFIGSILAIVLVFLLRNLLIGWRFWYEDWIRRRRIK